MRPFPAFVQRTVTPPLRKNWKRDTSEDSRPTTKNFITRGVLVESGVRICTPSAASGRASTSRVTIGWFLIIEIEPQCVAALTPGQPGEGETENSGVVTLKLLTSPPKEASIRIAASATFDDLVLDARSAFCLDESMRVWAVDDKEVIYSGKLNVLAALQSNKNTHVYITVDM